MRILKKLYQISQLTGSNFKQEVYRFLRAYRATPHSTTKVAPADLMYPNRKFRTRLPIGVTPRAHEFEQLYQRDFEKKMKMKGYADNNRYVKTSDLQIGDSVLVRRQAGNKATPAYETEPLQVQYRKGTRVVAKRADGSTITRTTAHFKKVPFRSAEDDQGQSTPEWPTEPVGESTLSTGENECPGMEQSNETIAEMGESVQTEGVAPTRPQAPQVGEEGLRRSERHRKETGSYLKESTRTFSCNAEKTLRSMTQDEL